VGTTRSMGVVATAILASQRTKSGERADSPTSTTTVMIRGGEAIGSCVRNVRTARQYAVDPSQGSERQLLLGDSPITARGAIRSPSAKHGGAAASVLEDSPTMELLRATLGELVSLCEEY